MSDPSKELEKLSSIFEAEKELEAELSKRGHCVLAAPNRGGFEDCSPGYGMGTIVKSEWLAIQDTQGTLYIYKEVGTGGGPETQELIYAEDIATGRCVGRGDTELMIDACSLLRQKMVLDDLADV